MDRKYIQSVKPLTDHVLQVDFISGSRLLLDMKPYLDKFRSGHFPTRRCGTAQ